VRGPRSEKSKDAGENIALRPLKRKTHLTIKKVTEDMDGAFHFNTALSAIMELVNEIYGVIAKNESQSMSRELEEAIKTVIILLTPFVPHIAEEMWENLGHKKSLFTEKWPEYDSGATTQDTITMIIQINGRVRSRVEIDAKLDAEEIKRIATQDATVNKWTKGKAPKKVIVVKGKLVNLVI
jgi:leucyl-tRNA synthetase